MQVLNGPTTLLQNEFRFSEVSLPNTVSIYETSIRAITGQTEPVSLFVSQLSGWTTTTNSKISQFQLDAHVAAPGKVVLIGASYMLAASGDCLDFTAASERHLGEYFAKVYARVIFDGLPWEPVRPTKITVNGNPRARRDHGRAWQPSRLRRDAVADGQCAPELGRELRRSGELSRDPLVDGSTGAVAG